MCTEAALSVQSEYFRKPMPYKSFVRALQRTQAMNTTK
jgi:hypothetical protein